ncbi:Bro-N domain-containing protein, partial [Clostridium sp.]|uniref:BRO-N domain-containing protein n=1 Tax=Clostridium sp. TaxID=1506 RepID=UPI0026221442
MNELQIFNNEEFGQVRMLVINNEAYFVGKDIAEILGYKNISDALKKHVDEEDKGVAKCDTLGGTQSLTTINESGLYSLILSSKLSGAKKFKRWVTSEVLPQIRKTGGYIPIK